MLLNLEVYDTSVPVPQCIINDHCLVLSPINAVSVIADVTGTRLLHGVIAYAASAAFSITIQSYIPPSQAVGLGD